MNTNNGMLGNSINTWLWWWTLKTITYPNMKPNNWNKHFAINWNSFNFDLRKTRVIRNFCDSYCCFYLQYTWTFRYFPNKSYKHFLPYLSRGVCSSQKFLTDKWIFFFSRICCKTLLRWGSVLLTQHWDYIFFHP